MMFDLDGKVAIVTGAARGIGAAYSRALAAAGAAVVVADVLETEGRATVDQIVAAGGRAAFVAADVSDPASTRALAAAAVATFGGIDVLINNAAVFASLTRGAFDEIDPDRWDRTMAVNVKGPWLCTCAVVPHMRARGGGSIINQCSLAAFGLAGMLDYSVSKTAVIGLTKNTAIELGKDRIRVNAITPGGTATVAAASLVDGGDFAAMEARSKASQLIPELIRPDDLVGTILYLASDASRLMTGQTLIVDGGRHFLG
jgi:3-oxoacyl-[acyl-carrier protein] reductase